MENEVISQRELFKLFYERKTLSWAQLGEMFAFNGTNENSRQVLGAIGNLVVEGYVEKLPGITPPIWKITKSGIAEYTGRPLSSEEVETYNRQVHDVGSDMRSQPSDAEMEARLKELQLQVDSSLASAKKASLLSGISMAIAILSVILLLFLGKCNT